MHPAVVIVQCAEVVYLGFCKKTKGPTFEKIPGEGDKNLPQRIFNLNSTVSPFPVEKGSGEGNPLPIRFLIFCMQMVHFDAFYTLFNGRYNWIYVFICRHALRRGAAREGGLDSESDDDDDSRPFGKHSTFIVIISFKI